MAWFGSLHHGHSGIVEAARELYLQIEGNPDNIGNVSESGGFLSSLMGAGCECDGYNLRIVGHSLGGAIAALLGIRLYGRYPKLHVYSFGPLPCVDASIAGACSDFVTSIVYDNEFSSRLSVASILRLQASAMTAVSEDTAADSAMIYKLARRFLFVSNHLQSKPEEKLPTSRLSSVTMASESNHVNARELRNGSREQEEALSLCYDMEKQISSDDESESNSSIRSFTNPFGVSPATASSSDNPVSRFLEAVPSAEGESSTQFPEMFLPGLIIHIVPRKRGFSLPLWTPWKSQNNECHYEAYITNRDAFKDMVVSPLMFIDHLPWRCHYAMKTLLAMKKREALHDESQMTGV